MRRTTHTASSSMLSLRRSCPVITCDSSGRARRVSHAKAPLDPWMRWPLSTGSESRPGRAVGRHLALLLCFTEKELRLRAGETPGYRFQLVLLFLAQAGL